MEGVVVNSAPAHVDNLASASQPARRGAANLDVRLPSNRLELEHGVEGRDLQCTDVGHIKQIRHRADRRFRNPAVILFLRSPQDRQYRGCLAAFRIFGDLLFCPGKIFRREREVRGLKFFRGQAADGHCCSASHCMRRAALALILTCRTRSTPSSTPVRSN